MKKLLFLVLCNLSVFTVTCAQKIVQIVKGNVTDQESLITLPGANVVIAGTDPLLGAVTDQDGNFKIENVPVGRYNINISYLGYDPVTIPEILVGSGKEVVINVGLKESLTQMEQVVVKAHARKDKPLNTMAAVSARLFTVEETRRYAGGLDDPARLVSAFAGVTTGNLQDNAIVIRGNSPKGVSWRLEGVDIPNPNHFSGGNIAGGGAVCIISSQLLSNSDFFTGAFPAEYGNALAGVFDLKLRSGNTEKREYTFQAGLMGIDFAAEGPFVKGKNASYLFNYRYSTFGLLTNLGLIPSEQIPVYQDLSFKLNFPTRKTGIFSLWGTGAIDFNHEPIDHDSSAWETAWDRVTYDWKVNLGAIGLTHKYIFRKNTYINTSLVATANRNSMDMKRLDDQLIEKPNWYFTDNSAKLVLSSFINHKFSVHHTNRTGFNFNTLFYNIDLNGTINDIPETYRNFVKEDDYNSHLQLYTQSRYDFSTNLSFNAGVHAEYLLLNGNFTIDPRLGMKWEFVPGHVISFGYGKHSQLEELKIYGINRRIGNNNTYPNKNLDFSHAHHFVLGYDLRINENIRLKIEPYYQHLYNIPGIPDSSYSMINFKQDWTFRDSLANNSTGRNIGIDFTLERFLNNNFYYLVTASVFDSKYKGDDGIWRNSRYDKEFVANVLVGKEFFIGRNKSNILGLNGRLNIIGGERISPILIKESMAARREIYDENRAFEDQEAYKYYLDLTITYRINKKRHASILALQLKNALGAPLSEGYSYNYKNDDIQKDETVVILPVISYKIEF
ncbi:MAG: TonB-dependent receptor [Bacteroidales bacterium]|nr:TonB-dependent receptor [Bacteroidales bacterium]